MWKAALFGAFALATIGTTGAVAQDVQITEAHIAQAKQVLHLTSEQQKYWPAVEAALHRLIAAQSQDEGSSGMLSRLGSRAANAASAAVGIKRVWAAAQPLVRVLDEEQKRSAMAMVRALGGGKYASAL